MHDPFQDLFFLFEYCIYAYIYIYIKMLHFFFFSVAEWVAKYAHVKLKGEKGVTEAEAEEELNKLMLLFRFLDSKDVIQLIESIYI
jgi:hypothetical protein